MTARPGIVGRRRELEAVAAALDAGCDVLLEGAPGTGKTALARAAAARHGRPVFAVEGNADLTPARLAGAHDPSTVLHDGYRAADFVPGPLVEAMRAGGVLYVEGLNRVPADALNLLLGPLAERRLTLPRVGLVEAAEGFALVATASPLDSVGTTGLSRSVLDRVVRVALEHSPEDDERAVVRERTGSDGGWLVNGAVALVRATRSHPELESGASVRGAIDLVAVAERLAAQASLVLGEHERDAQWLVLRAALLALSGRVVCAATTARPVEEILRELWEDVFLLASRRARGKRTLEVSSSVTTPVGSEPWARPRRRLSAVAPRELAPPDVDRPAAWPKPGALRGPPTVLGAAEVEAQLGARRAPGKPRPEDSDDELADLGGAGRAGARPEDDQDPEELHERALRLAREIMLRLPRRTATPAAGRGRLKPIRYRFNSDDLDLDRTLEEIAGNPFPEAEDFWVQERVRTRRAFALMLDVSGSMRGRQLVSAAVATGALATAIERDDLAVVAFWRDAAVLQPLGPPVATERLLRRVLSLSARGLTNLHLGLELGLRELSGARSQDRVGIVFSDAGHNLGGDPLDVAGRYDVLHVVGTSLEPARVRACHDVAARGGGRCVFAPTLEEIPGAINACLGV